MLNHNKTNKNNRLQDKTRKEKLDIITLTKNYTPSSQRIYIHININKKQHTYTHNHKYLCMNMRTNA